MGRWSGAETRATNAAIALAVGLGFAASGIEPAWKWGLWAGARHFVPYAGLAVMMAVVEVYAQHASWAAGYVALVGAVFGSGLATWMHGRASRVNGAIMFGGAVFLSGLWGDAGLVLGPLLVVVVRVQLRHVAMPAGLVRPTASAMQPTDEAGHARTALA